MNFRLGLTILRFASEIVDKIPREGDSKLVTITKLLSIADSAQKIWTGGQKVLDIFGRFDLKEATNEPFVRLFFATRLKERFSLARFPIDQYNELIMASGPRGERFVFQETRYSGTRISSEFFHTPDIDFSALLENLWQDYKTGLYLSIGSPDTPGHDVTYQEIPSLVSDRITAKGAGRLQEVFANCRADQAAGITRCYIAVGPPGTGKSSFVVRLANLLGGRLLKIDASSLPRFGVQELSFLLDALRPNVLLVDDFDRVPLEHGAARLLSLLEFLKTKSVMTIVTVNNPAALDAAMLRSERIDEPIDFDLPDAEERRDLIKQLLPETSNEARLVSETEGFNHSDINDLCRRLAREPLEKVLKMKKRLRALATEAAAPKLVATSLNNPSALSFVRKSPT